jgi:hypothetical protein
VIYPSDSDLQGLYPKGVIQFCLSLIEHMPKIDAFEQAKIGKTNIFMIKASITALTEALVDESIDLSQFTQNLQPIIKSITERAIEIEKIELSRPNNNYGFSGAADTDHYIYSFFVNYLNTIKYALSLEAVKAKDSFLSALKNYAIQSCHGDPKGAIPGEIKEAETKGYTIISEAFEKIQGDLKGRKNLSQDFEPPEVNKEIMKVPKETDTIDTKAKKVVFISCSNRDYSNAESLYNFLMQHKIQVFFSEKTLPRLGNSDYRRAIDNALEQAEHMIIVTSSNDNVTSSWVEAEWGLFINELRSGYKHGNLLTMFIPPMTIRELPASLRNYTAIEFSPNNFEKVLPYLQCLEKVIEKTRKSSFDVFISYSIRDKNVANALCAALENRKIRCWIAPRNVPAGMSFPAAIIEGLNNSSVCVLVFSDSANKSNQVIREVERAVMKELVIIPFRIEDVEPTESMAYLLAFPKWLDALTPPIEKHIQELVDRVQFLLTDKKDQHDLN